MSNTKNQYPKAGGDPYFLLKQPGYRKAQRKLIKNGNDMADFLTKQVKA